MTSMTPEEEEAIDNKLFNLPSPSPFNVEDEPNNG